MAFFNITKITIPQTFAIPRNLLVNFVNFSHKWGYFHHYKNYACFL